MTELCYCTRTGASILNHSFYCAKLNFNEGYILCSSVEYNKPRYNSLTSPLVLPAEDNFSSTTSRDVCTLYWNCKSSSGFRHDMYFGEFCKEKQLCVLLCKICFVTDNIQSMQHTILLYQVLGNCCYVLPPLYTTQFASCV